MLPSIFDATSARLTHLIFCSAHMVQGHMGQRQGPGPTGKRGNITLDGIIITPTLGHKGRDGQMLSDGVGGGGAGELFPQDLYSEKQKLVYIF
jgi:hypothetical protein